MDETTFSRRLIDAVSGKKLLYNPYHPDQEHKLKQENVWKYISASLNSTGKRIYNISDGVCLSNLLQSNYGVTASLVVQLSGFSEAVFLIIHFITGTYNSQ